MALNIFKQVSRLSSRTLINKTSKRFYSIYEPDYLETGKSKIPLYPTLNIQIKGYKYPLLESYQVFINKVTNLLDIDVDDSWAMPHQELRVQRFKSKTTIIDSEYILKIYERSLIISELSSTKCAALVRILEAALPEGVSLKIDVHDPATDQKRYIPDKLLLDLKSELTTIKKK